jgi:hypothetical protein
MARPRTAPRRAEPGTRETQYSGRLPSAWPGITEPRCELCTWAFFGGTYQIKYINRACMAHSRFLVAPGGVF